MHTKLLFALLMPNASADYNSSVLKNRLLSCKGQCVIAFQCVGMANTTRIMIEVDGPSQEDDWLNLSHYATISLAAPPMWLGRANASCTTSLLSIGYAATDMSSRHLNRAHLP